MDVNSAGISMEKSMQLIDENASNLEDDNSLNIVQLPTEILILILTFLDQHDLAFLSRTAKNFAALLKAYQKDIHFISAINKEIISLGYTLPKFEFAFIGLAKIEDQILFLNKIKTHRRLRQNLTIFNVLNEQRDKEDPQYYKNEMKKYQQNIQGFLSMTTGNSLNILAMDQLKRLSYLENCVKNERNSFNFNSPYIYNPIFLRISIEVLRLSALLDPSSANSHLLYKELFLTSYLLLKLHDPSAYFCLVDIVSKCAAVKKSKLVEYFRTHINDIHGNDSDFLRKLSLNAFAENGIKLEELVPPDKINSFIRSFNYTRAFFFPKTTLKLLLDLKSLCGEESRIFFANVSNSLFKCFVSSYALFFNKIFPDKKTGFENLNFFKTCKNPIENLLAVSKHETLFVKLTVQDLMGIPVRVLEILRVTSKIYDEGSWDNNYIDFLNQKMSRLEKVPTILQYWSAKNIKAFLENNDEDFFVTIANCQHNKMLFMQLSYDDILFFWTQDKKLLAWICKKNNSLAVKTLLNTSKDVRQLTEKIQTNETLQKILFIENSNIFFEKFPKYFHCLREEKIVFDSGCIFLLNMLGEHLEAFLLMYDLCQGQYFNLVKNRNLFEQLKNPLFYQYVKNYQLSFGDIQQNQPLFNLFLNQSKEASHSYLLCIPLQSLKELYNEGLLSKLFSIKSKSLFAWVLFNKVTDSQNHENSKETLKMRKIDELKNLFNFSVIANLDSFGFSLNAGETIQFQHCDSALLSKFNVEELISLETDNFDQQSLLKHLCSMNPSVAMMLIEKAAKNNENISEVLVSYLTLPFLQVLNTSSHGWMLLCYFDKDFLNDLNVLVHNGFTLLQWLMFDYNKPLFDLMIKQCITSEPIQTIPFFRAQNPPTVYKINATLFMKLLNAVVQSGYILSEDCRYFLQNNSLERIFAFLSDEQSRNDESKKRKLSVFPQPAKFLKKTEEQEEDKPQALSI